MELTSSFFSFFRTVVLPALSRPLSVNENDSVNEDEQTTTTKMTYKKRIRISLSFCFTFLMMDKRTMMINCESVKLNKKQNQNKNFATEWSSVWQRGHRMWMSCSCAALRVCCFVYRWFNSAECVPRMKPIEDSNCKETSKMVKLSPTSVPIWSQYCLVDSNRRRMSHACQDERFHRVA